MPRDRSAVEGASIRRDVARRVWGFARPYRLKILAFVGIVALTALASIVPALIFRELLDNALPNRNRGLVTTLALLVVAIALIEAVLNLLERWWSSQIGEGLIYDLRSSLFDHVQRMPLSFFLRTQTGALISRLNNDVIGAQRALTGTLGSVVSNVITLVTTLVAMAVFEWRLTLLALLVLPAFILPTRRVGARLQELTRQGMNHNAAMNTTMTERFNVSGALLVKLFGRHDEERDEFADRAAQVRDIGIRSAMYGRVFFISLGLVGTIGTALIYGLGGHLVISGSITPGDLGAMSLLVGRIYQPLTGLTNARVDIMTAFVSFERVFEVLDAPDPLAERPGAVDLVDPSGRIDFEHVTFAYPGLDETTVASLEHQAPADGSGGRAVLDDLDLTIEPGQTIALVGPSGAGKTTFTTLVNRLYDVTTGAVRIDGHDVRDLTTASLRAAIGVVNQDPHLFHESVGDNLRFAHPDATDTEIEAAARAARIHDVIADLPEGYDTVVGERGYRLSGGEKQRLAIARMLLKDPAIVILDEATSQLDSENEQIIQEALAEALEGRTALVIAHRLSTIRDADHILVLDEGRLAERGRHADLMAANGLYAELYRTLVRSQQDQLTTEPAGVPLSGGA
ncbi:MAG: ABC transporter ATP-binding protein [Actinomycetia bacterium]|nr:ABC transporter ATP-binding protein [Actinomycetes bacterium]